MPPVREASTKPSAATVLPAPVACSNQKRLAALGSSASSVTSSSSESDQSTGSSSASSSSLQLLGQLLLARAGRRARARPARRRRRRSCARCRCAAPRPAARSACRTARRPGGPTAPCRRRARARPGRAGGRGPAAATSGGASASRAPSRPRRARPARQSSAAPARRARARARSRRPRPSSRKGSRVNEAARSRSSEDGRDATARVAVSGSAMKARLIDVGRSRVVRRTTSSNPDRNGEASSGAPAREATHIQAESATASDRSATVCPDATVCGHSRRSRPGRGAGRRPAAGGRRQHAKKRNFDLAQAKRELAGAPAPLAVAARAVARSCCPAARRPSASGSRASRATPWWSTSGPRGAVPCRTEFPLFQQQAVNQGKQVAFIGVNAGDSTDPAHRFLNADAAARSPSYLDHDEDIAKTIKAPANYPITVFFDRRGKLAYVHQGGYRQRVRPRRRHAALPVLMASRSAGPATSRSSPPPSRCARRSSAASRASRSTPTSDGRDAEALQLVAVDGRACSARAGC